jgi:hypothetical protein
MSINRIRQLGGLAKQSQPNPVDEEWGDGWNDSDDEVDTGKDWGAKKEFEFEAGGFDDDDDFGNEDDDDDFGTKKAAINKLDDDTPEDNNRAIVGEDGDDSDLDGLGFDLQEAVAEGKRAVHIEEGKAQKQSKAEAEERKRQQEDEEFRRKVEQKVKEEREARLRREREEAEAVKFSVKERIDVSLSRNKGSTIDKGSRDDSKGLSDDLKGFLGQLDNTKNKPKDSFQLDGSSIRNNDLEDNKTFEEFEVEEKFKDLEKDEP